VVFAIEGEAVRLRDPLLPAKLATLLPPGTYRFANAPHDARLAALGWLTGSHRFTRYKASSAKPVRLAVPEGVDGAAGGRIAEAVAMGRDLIATPANDLGPDELEAAARALGAAHGASVAAIVGEDLLAQNFPMIHAVGRASTRPPRLVDLAWGDPDDPKVT